MGIVCPAFYEVEGGGSKSTRCEPLMRRAASGLSHRLIRIPRPIATGFTKMLSSSIRSCERLAEHHLRRVHHLAREDVFGAVGLHGLSVLDEAFGHLSAEQDGIARIGQLDDARNHSLLGVPVLPQRSGGD